MPEPISRLELPSQAHAGSVEVSREARSDVRPSGEIEQAPLAAALRDAWAHRRVAIGLMAQVVTTRWPKSILGAWWIPIMIVLNAISMAFIFGTVLGIPSASGIPYFLFVTVGMMAWWAFNRGVIFSMRSFLRFRKYVMNHSFPLILVPFAGAAQVILELVFYAIFIACALLVFWGIDGELYLNLSPELLLAPVALAWLVLLAIGLGLLTGVLYWRARDVRFLYRLVLPFLLFLTPVIYPLSSLDGALKIGTALNPLAPPVEIFKMAILGTSGPALYSLVSGLAVAGILLAVGLWFTNRYGYRLLTTNDDGELEEEAA